MSSNRTDVLEKKIKLSSSVICSGPTEEESDDQRLIFFSVYLLAFVLTPLMG
jgi:hypothetical protein